MAFKMKGNPMHRNFGIGSPEKSGLKHSVQDDPVLGEITPVGPHSHDEEPRPKDPSDWLTIETVPGASGSSGSSGSSRSPRAKSKNKK